ncbi:lactadherin-like [Dendronephthya gigantea]|uniref:lactadherin-like n=1 Tax=Dendronephthya gigantea TaxID=151771 RepID=UPI00106D2955|nr:lactadherin-like [Dendronephthya gigantea]
MNPLGIENGTIPDSAITASSVYNSIHPPFSGRLNKANSPCSWGPSRREGSWLQIDLGKLTTVSAIATQGSCYGAAWAKSYSVTYSNDGKDWTAYRESEGTKIFESNRDRNSIVIHTFKIHINARYIRVLPKTWHVVPVIRLELYGCPH